MATGRKRHLSWCRENSTSSSPKRYIKRLQLLAAVAQQFPLFKYFFLRGLRSYINNCKIYHFTANILNLTVLSVTLSTSAFIFWYNPYTSRPQSTLVCFPNLCNFCNYRAPVYIGYFLWPCNRLHSFVNIQWHSIFGMRYVRCLLRDKQLKNSVESWGVNIN